MGQGLHRLLQIVVARIDRHEETPPPGRHETLRQREAIKAASLLPQLLTCSADADTSLSQGDGTAEPVCELRRRHKQVNLPQLSLPKDANAVERASSKCRVDEHVTGEFTEANRRARKENGARTQRRHGLRQGEQCRVEHRSCRVRRETGWAAIGVKAALGSVQHLGRQHEVRAEGKGTHWNGCGYHSCYRSDSNC